MWFWHANTDALNSAPRSFYRHFKTETINLIFYLKALIQQANYHNFSSHKMLSFCVYVRSPERAERKWSCLGNLCKLLWNKLADIKQLELFWLRFLLTSADQCMQTPQTAISVLFKLRVTVTFTVGLNFYFVKKKKYKQCCIVFHTRPIAPITHTPLGVTVIENK